MSRRGFASAGTTLKAPPPDGSRSVAVGVIVFRDKPCRWTLSLLFSEVSCVELRESSVSVLESLR